MQVLHLIDAASPQATGTTLAMIADAQGRLGDVEQTVALLGGTHLRDSGLEAGVDDPVFASTPFGHAPFGWPRLRRALRDRGLHPRDFDLIHCWSVGTFSLASLLLRGTPRALTLTCDPGRRACDWLRTLTAASPRGTTTPTALLPISSTLRRAVLSAGVPEPVTHVLRPGIDMGRVEHGRRAAIRASWGIEPNDDEATKVIAILSDPPHGADGVTGVRSIGIATEQCRGKPYKLRPLLHPQQLNRRVGELSVAALREHPPTIRSHRTEWPWQVLPGCDAALAFGPRAGGLALLWAMAANVPIVGEATYAISEIIEDRHSALLTQPDAPPSNAYKLVQLLDDQQLAWKLRDTARHEAYSFFSRRRYCESIKTVYEQLLAGQPVDIPPLESTGGLRFTGRG